MNQVNVTLKAQIAKVKNGCQESKDNPAVVFRKHQYLNKNQFNYTFQTLSRNFPKYALKVVLEFFIGFYQTD